MVGAWLWIASALQLFVQVIVANAWPDGYSISHNTISDLGVTTCGPYDQGGIQSRMVCSPQYEVFNASLIVMGALLVVGSLLLWDAWPRRRTGNAGLVLVILGGLGVAGVGLTPSDLFGALHGPAAFLQAAFQWFAMLVFAFAVPANAGTNWKAIRMVSLVLFVISILGFTVFLLGSNGVVFLGIQWGIAERIAFDTLTLWSAALGALLLRAFPRPLPAGQQTK